MYINMNDNNNNKFVSELIYRSVNCQPFPSSIIPLGELLGETEVLLLESLSNDQTPYRLFVSGGELLYER